MGIWIGFSLFKRIDYIGVNLARIWWSDGNSLYLEKRWSLFICSVGENPYQICESDENFFYLFCWWKSVLNLWFGWKFGFFWFIWLVEICTKFLNRMKIFKFLAEKVQLFWFLKLVLLFDAKNQFIIHNAISYWTYISNKEK